MCKHFISPAASPVACSPPETQLPLVTKQLVPSTHVLLLLCRPHSVLCVCVFLLKQHHFLIIAANATALLVVLMWALINETNKQKRQSLIYACLNVLVFLP